MFKNFQLPEITFGALTMDKLLSTLLVLALCLVGIKILMRLVSRMLAKSKVDKTLHRFIYSAVYILLYVLTGLVVADQLAIQVTSLIAVLSVVGLAISLAVQGALSNVMGGVMILLNKPFVVGDYVEAGEISGTVDEIGLSYTKFMMPDNKMVFVPNSDIASARIINYTNATQRRLEIKVTASYDSPTERVKKALCAAAARHEEIASDPPVFANISDYRDSCIEYILRVWVPTDDYWPIYFALLEEIREEFEKDAVEMTYPHMNVHMLQK
ncbi:MAG: mechanosensitive ion channel family protein [Candidatus Fimivivens sp.]